MTCSVLETDNTAETSSGGRLNVIASMCMIKKTVNIAGNKC